MDEIPVTKARAELSDLVNRVVYGGERIVLTRHGKAVAAIVSAADLQRLGPVPEPGPAHAEIVVLGSEPGPALAPAADWRTEPPRA